MQPFLDFFMDHAPTPRQWWIAGPPSVAWAALSLSLAAWLKSRRGWRTGLTRKTFHLLTYVSAAAIQASLGLEWLAVYGASSSLVILYALVRGDGFGGYEALARESDAPHRTRLIVIPYVATLIGGVTSNVWCGSFAVVGFLVTGLGDAVGEPVGLRYGRHRYHPPTWGGAPTTRSLEGSTAVFLVSSLATFAACVWIGVPVSASMAALCVAIGFISCLAESVSPHGGDNFVLMLLPSALGAWWLSP